MLAEGTAILQETRHWDENRGVTTHGRSKEYAFDYRYFPEPDLPPIEPDQAWIDRLRAELPELPATRRSRLEAQYGLDPRQAALVSVSRDWTDFFEQAVSLGADARAVANWMTGDLAGLLNEHSVELSASKRMPSSRAPTARCSGRTPTSSSASPRPSSGAGNRFIAGEPMKRATKVLTGSL